MQTLINDSIHPLLIQLNNYIAIAVEAIWYYPVVFLCLFCGIFFTLRFGLIQFRGFKHAIELVRGKYDNPNEIGQITPFKH